MNTREIKVGDFVKTWISDKAGKVVAYDKKNQKVTVKTRGCRYVEDVPVAMCTKV